jgi:hypothetical protein
LQNNTIQTYFRWFPPHRRYRSSRVFILIFLRDTVELLKSQSHRYNVNQSTYIFNPSSRETKMKT